MANLGQIQSISADRADPEQIAAQAALLDGSNPFYSILNTVSSGVAVLNQERQIVFLNKALAGYAGLTNQKTALGLKPGEALGCYHAFETSGGCGTSDYCRACGALIAILMAQNGKQSIQECRISRSKDDKFEALDLRITTTPLVVDNEQLTVFSVTNIADEKRRQALERIFLHDLRNTASIINGVAEIIGQQFTEEPQYSQMLNRAAHKLIDEIDAQQQLLAAENGQLQLNKEYVSSKTLVSEIIDLYEQQNRLRECHFQIDPEAQKFVMLTDRAILGRVIGNMVKNAAEACAPGETVTVNCWQQELEAYFSVHNPTYIPHHVQRQIFKRSFSTKGKNRGLGTYSMRLLSEEYLAGRVGFVSDKTRGTTFTVVCPVGNILNANGLTIR